MVTMRLLQSRGNLGGELACSPSSTSMGVSTDVAAIAPGTVMLPCPAADVVMLGRYLCSYMRSFTSRHRNTSVRSSSISTACQRILRRPE